MPAPASDARHRPIAVFDSGVGGLTVLQELLVALPQEDFIYFGDTARFPYGGRATAELERFGLEIAEHLIELGAKLLVVACNSATAAALPALERRVGAAAETVHVLGVVEPESALAVEASRSGRIGLLATPATVTSGAYERAVALLDPAAELVSVGCPDLAPLIQGGLPFNERVLNTVRGYCEPLRAAGVDTVILGCTHYPLAGPMLRRMLGRDVALITSGAAVTQRVEHSLTRHGLLNDRDGEGDYRFLCTGDVEAFGALGARFLQMPLGEVARVRLAELPAGLTA